MISKKRIELHCHSKLSGKGTMYPGELIRYMSEEGVPAFAITDETGILAYPELEQVWETGKYTSRPIYGLEANVSEGDEKNSISVLIKNEVGKRFIYGLLTSNATEDFVPYFDLDVLLKNRKGLLLGSGTYKGRVYTKALNGLSDVELKKELSLYDYIEILPYKEYEDVNKIIINLCTEINIPVVAVCGFRYKDKIGRKAIEIINHWNDDSSEVLDNHLWTTEEMLTAFSYLSEEKAKEIVIDNTYLVADMCESISVCPKERYYPSISGAAQKLRNLCMTAIEEKYPNCKERAEKHCKFELEAIENTGTASYILQMKELLEMSYLRACDISLRGVGAGSITAYLMGISDVDPIKYKLSPELIFGFNKNREIDIDINIPNGRIKEVHENVEKIKGIKKAVYGGTVVTVSEKLADAMIEKYEDDKGCYFEESLNKLRWYISGNYLGRSKHPGGFVIFPDNCNYEETIPLAKTADGLPITYFNYHSTYNSFIKIDLLKHDSLEMLSKLSKRTGIALDSIPVDDEKVLELFKVDENDNVVDCADLPEFKYETARKITSILKPTCIEELAKVCALLHGTDVWYENGEKLVSERKLGIRDIVGSRDDVFDYIVSLGVDRETAYNISEAVRKGIVARGRNAKWQGWKKQLIEAGASDWYVWSLEQIKYLFPRAHTTSYMIITMRLGWFKVYYPNEFAEVMKEYDDVVM